MYKNNISLMFLASIKSAHVILIILLLQSAFLTNAGALDLKEFKQTSKPRTIDFTKKLEEEREAHEKDMGSKRQENFSTMPNHLEKAETKEWALSVDAKSKEMISKQIFASPNKTCQEIGADINTKSPITSSELSPSLTGLPSFYIFVSLNMKEKNLKLLLREAAKYNGVLVIRGLKNDSMIETVNYLQTLLKEKHEGVIIDPNLFRKYRIDKVPSFVVAKHCFGSRCDQQYDTIKGNITPHFALSKIMAKGDLKSEAERLLK